MIWPLTGRTGTGVSGASTAPVPVAISDLRPRATTSPSASGDAGRRARASTRARVRGPRRRRARTRVLSAATSRRGSTEWSPGTSSASRTVGASAGSARRAWLGRSRSTSQAELAPEGELALERLGLVAVARDQQRAGACRSRPTSSPSSAQKPRSRARARRPSSTARRRRTRPRRRARACRRPPARRRGRRRRARPCAGRGRPRATRTRGRSPRRRLRRGRTCSEVTAGHSLPTPALPGSGSTVGGPLPPSQPVVRAPVCAYMVRPDG